MKVNHIENMCVFLFGIFLIHIWKSASIERYCLDVNVAVLVCNYTVRKCICCSQINANRMQGIRCFCSVMLSLYLSLSLCLSLAHYVSVFVFMFEIIFHWGNNGTRQWHFQRLELCYAEGISLNPLPIALRYH